VKRPRYSEHSRLVRVAFATEEQARAFDLACDSTDPAFALCPAIAKVVAVKVARQSIDGARVVCEPGMVAVWPSVLEE